MPGHKTGPSQVLCQLGHADVVIVWLCEGRCVISGWFLWQSGQHASVAGCKSINNYTLVNMLPSCTETEHSQQEVLTLTQMSSPVTTDTDATQHPDTTRPGNASKRADSAHKQPNRTSSPTRLHLSPLSAFQRRITRLTTQRELRTPRVPATQQQWQPASQLEARARSRDVPTAALWCSFPQPQNQSTTTPLYSANRLISLSLLGSHMGEAYWMAGCTMVLYSYAVSRSGVIGLWPLLTAGPK